MKKKIILVGGGGHCHSLIDVIEAEQKYDIYGIIDKKELLGKDILGYKIIGTDDDLSSIFEECKNAVISLGHVHSNKLRVEVFKQLKKIGYALPTIISPHAYISKHSSIEEGTVIFHGAIINANVKIGKNCIVNSKALIEHDVIVEDNCHLSTASVLNGSVIVRENTFIGSNSTCVHNISVSGFIKAGSLVKKSKEVFN